MTGLVEWLLKVIVIVALLPCALSLGWLLVTSLLVAGITLYAIDSLRMTRPRRWNYRQVFLDGSNPDRSVRIPRRPDCRLCGTGS